MVKMKIKANIKILEAKQKDYLIKKKILNYTRNLKKIKTFSVKLLYFLGQLNMLKKIHQLEKEKVSLEEF